MIFGCAEPLESYCAHLLLSKDEIYFSVLETKGSRSLYGPRPTMQVYVRFGFNTHTHTHIYMCVCVCFFYISKWSSLKTKGQLST
jgi:hypothetical protein